MAQYHKHFSTTVTPQNQPVPGREKEQVKMASGGYGFKLEDWDQMRRFLILGAEGGTYYVGERDLTIANTNAVASCIKQDGKAAVDLIVQVSDGGLAPKNDPALFALAMASSKSFADEPTRKYAFDNLRKIARIPTHLFQYIEYTDAFRGWGRGRRSAVANWYNEKPVGQLAYHVAKYQSRNGWGNRDALRLGHPKTEDPTRNSIYKWVVGGLGEKAVSAEELASWQNDETLKIIWAFEQAKKATSAAEIVRLIADYDLPRECIPTNFLNDREVWEALLVNMPITAMVRNLGKMTSIGLIAPLSYAEKLVHERLTNEDRLVRGRVHPMTLLVALKTYEQGHGDKGSLQWSPTRGVIDGLDSGFYVAFKAVEPTGKAIEIAIDGSGSMSAAIMGIPTMTCREAAVAMALITANVEDQYLTVGFTMDNKIQEVPISPKQRLMDAIREFERRVVPEGTDCALPFQYAMQRKLHVDAFCLYTDNESWAGSIHPFQALNQYRQQSGNQSKLAIVAMAANMYSLADPKDKDAMGFCGFDTSAPNIMSAFIRGDI